MTCHQNTKRCGGSQTSTDAHGHRVPSSGACKSRRPFAPPPQCPPSTTPKMVRLRPPASHFLGEDPECTLRRRFHSNALAHRLRWSMLHSICHGCACYRIHHVLFLLHFGFKGVQGLAPEPIEIQPHRRKPMRVQPVVIPRPHRLHADQPRFLQHAQMLRNRGAGSPATLFARWPTVRGPRRKRSNSARRV